MLPFLSGTTQGPYGDSRKDVRAGAHWLSGLGKAGAGGAAGSGSAGGGGGNCTLRLRQITLEDIWTAKLQVEVPHEGTAQEEAAEEKASPAAAKLGGAPTPPLGGALSLEAALGMGHPPRLASFHLLPAPLSPPCSALPRLFLVSSRAPCATFLLVHGTPSACGWAYHMHATGTRLMVCVPGTGSRGKSMAILSARSAGESLKGEGLEDGAAFTPGHGGT
ncbi:unnamed protein product [Closterium sp. NIES-65]|nr:unnamed protein product [Closterium sp. NIES-65]